MCSRTSRRSSERALPFAIHPKASGTVMPGTGEMKDQEACAMRATAPRSVSALQVHNFLPGLTTGTQWDVHPQKMRQAQRAATQPARIVVKTTGLNSPDLGDSENIYMLQVPVASCRDMGTSSFTVQTAKRAKSARPPTLLQMAINKRPARVCPRRRTR
ncbi:hypothetical protein BKA93DRAFT_85253 [Sparassis latifolia]